MGGFASLGGSVDYTNSIPMYLMTDPIIGVRPSMPEASLDKNLQILELVDQVKTDVELAKRSASKISHDAKAVMIKKDSPVKVLSLFVKALKQKKTPVLKG